MPTYDFRCTDGHTHEGRVKYDDRNSQMCPECGKPAKLVFLTAPKLDWMGMAQGPNAGPEFIDRFDKAHKQRAKQENEHKLEHGDAMRGAGG